LKVYEVFGLGEVTILVQVGGEEIGIAFFEVDSSSYGE